MLKKYLVYISSAREDLKAERLEICKIVTELGAVPICPDGFDPSGEDGQRIIRKTIEDCDYFVSLVAHKRGEAAGTSFLTEFEYSVAARKRIPVLALIIGEKARWKDSKKEKDAAAKKALEAFKRKLEGHVHDTWINMADMKQKALALISREMSLNPRRGWIPSTEAVEPCVANELARLIRENELLRSQIQMEGTDITQKLHKQMKQVLKMLVTNRISLSFYYTSGDNWENTQVFRYLKLFRLLTPELSTPKTAAQISHFLGNILNPDLEKTVRKDYPTPSNTIKKIMTDFTLLRLVKCSGSGDNEEWEMTEYGKETFTVYRLRQMNNTPNRNVESEEAKSDDDVEEIESAEAVDNIEV